MFGKCSGEKIFICKHPAGRNRRKSSPLTIGREKRRAIPSYCSIQQVFILVIIRKSSIKRSQRTIKVDTTDPVNCVRNKIGIREFIFLLKQTGIASPHMLLVGLLCGDSTKKIESMVAEFSLIRC